MLQNNEISSSSHQGLNQEIAEMIAKLKAQKATFERESQILKMKQNAKYIELQRSETQNQIVSIDTYNKHPENDS